MIECKAAFISDIHTGMPYGNVEKATEVMKKLRCDKLYLNGDIFDFDWLNKLSGWEYPYTRFVKHILKKAEHDTEVYYNRGNHDDFNEFGFNEVFPGFNIPNVELGIRQYYEYNDTRYLVTHGDVFDQYIPKWMYYLGGFAYWVALRLNDVYNKFRKWRGRSKFSLSQYLKDNVKQAVSHINKFENRLCQMAEAKNCDGVICGHIHKPQNKMIDGVHYLNSGDFIENNTVLIHKESGWEILKYSDIIN